MLAGKRGSLRLLSRWVRGWNVQAGERPRLALATFGSGISILREGRVPIDGVDVVYFGRRSGALVIQENGDIVTIAPIKEGENKECVLTVLKVIATDEILLRACTNAALGGER